MAAATAEKNSKNKRTNRAKAIAAMGLVNREGDKFAVSTPSLRGRQTSYEVWRDEAGKIRCNCLEFEEAVVEDSGFRCEHILAVKFALVAKNTEPAVKQPVEVKTEIEVKPGKVVSQKDKNVTESRTSERGEQKADDASENVSARGQAETKKSPKSKSLTNTQGENTMKQENLRAVSTDETNENAELVEVSDNVLKMEFPTKLRELRKNVDPELVRSREGWRDRSGNVHMVDYVEWHTVADILDETAPNWSHEVKDMRQIGDIFTVTVAITIDNITREGIGTGVADSEMGIKKAEHDALKRAAVKFGIARDLYKKESDTIEREGSIPNNVNDGGNNFNSDFPSNPIARSLSDLVTAKQLGMIRAIARDLGLDADEESVSVMNCKTDELSKRAASSLIQHLQDLQKQNPAQNQAPLRRAS